MHTFFYKNIIYKNIQAQTGQKIKNMLRISNCSNCILAIVGFFCCCCCCCCFVFFFKDFLTVRDWLGQSFSTVYNFRYKIKKLAVKQAAAVYNKRPREIMSGRLRASLFSWQMHNFWLLFLTPRLIVLPPYFLKSKLSKNASIVYIEFSTRVPH